MIFFVMTLDALKNAKCNGWIWLVYNYGLEATGERFVFFDIFAIFIERSCTNKFHRVARECWL